MRIVAVLALAAVVLGVAGCASASDTLSDAAGQAAAAAAGASIAVDLYADDRATTAATDTALSDAVRELQQADESATELEPGSGAREQAAVVEAIRRATDAVVGARQTLASAAPHGIDGRPLRESADALETLESELSGR